MTIQELTEKAKDYAENTAITHDQRLKLNDFLSQIRLQANLLDQRLREAEMRQNVYAEVAEKIWNRIIDNKYS